MQVAASLWGVVCGAAAAPFSCPRCLTLEVGPPEEFGGPVADNFDSPFAVVTTRLGARGYSSNQISYVVAEGTSVDTLKPVARKEVGLGRGSASDLDQCGAWLNAAAAVPGDAAGVVRGWYHEEWHCDYAKGFTNKSVAYAVSHDYGVTFTKQGHPHNVCILPAPGNTTPRAQQSQQVGEGDHGVAVDQSGGYLYLFFKEWGLLPHTPLRAGVARSSINDSEQRGVPGTWKKLFRGSFSSPGVGGNSDGLGGISGTSVVKRRTSGDFVSVGSMGQFYSKGPGLSFSPPGEEPVRWQPIHEPLLYTNISQWARPNQAELVAYPSFLPGEQPGTWWFFYTYLEPNATMTSRYLVRRKVAVAQLAAQLPSGAPVVRVALTLYRSGKDDWATTALVPAARHYEAVGPVAALMTEGANDRHVVYDCFIRPWGDHMAALGSECSGANTHRLRVLGWLFTSPRPDLSTVPLYRCFNNATLDHSVATDAGCGGRGRPEFILGYALPHVQRS